MAYQKCKKPYSAYKTRIMISVKVLHHLIVYSWHSLHPVIELSSPFSLQSYKCLFRIMLWAPDCLQSDPPGLLGLTQCQFSKQSIQISLHEGVNEERQLWVFWLSIGSGLIMWSTLHDKLFVFAEIKWNHLENYVGLLL